MEPRSGCAINAAVEALGDQWSFLVLRDIIRGNRPQPPQNPLTATMRDMPDIERWPTGRLLSTAARLVEHAWDENLRSIGLTHAGVIALEVLSATGPITQTTLAQIVRVQAQTMGQTLSRLETHGHVSRRRSTEDRRVHVVSLTDAGREALERAVESEQQVLAQVSIDTSMFRQELKILVRDLANRERFAAGGDRAGVPYASAAREE